MSGSLVDDVIEALQSHPDPYWAKRAAQRLLDEHIDDLEGDMCAGLGYVDESAAPKLLPVEETRLDEARAFVSTGKKSVAKNHVQALVDIITRLLEDGA